MTKTPKGRLLICLPFLLVAFSGCHMLDVYDNSLESSVPTEMQPPREMAMRSLPAYRIEPPDMIQIEVLKLMPLPPYHIENYDVLQINVLNTLIDQPINNYFIVDEGKIQLGPAYGWVRVAGMTTDEATDAIRKHLQDILRQPEVSVQLGRASGLQPVTGPYLVQSDGTVNLRQYGSIYVSGMTVLEAKLAIEKQLCQYLDSPEVTVDIGAFNSKTYYIITGGAGQGDNVVRIPITGNETVLDAISQIQGLSQLSSKKIWIARPAPSSFNCEQILPVDWDGIARGGLTATNYQIMPGDRVFIEEDTAIATTSLVSKIIGPFERVLGFGSLGASTIRSFQMIGYRQRYY